MVTNQSGIVTPFVGPVPIQKGQLLFGRDRETRTLTDLLVGKRIVLLHAASGAGKSSLVNAGLVPALAKYEFHLLPTIRLANEKQMPSANPSKSNRYTMSTLRHLVEEPGLAIPLSPMDLSSIRLTEYLDRRAKATSQAPIMLIFDQFEELLTADPFDVDAKHAFMADLGEALRDERRWAIFVIREDYVGPMEPYLHHIPTGLAVRMHLDLLSPAAAAEAIRRPKPIQKTTELVEVFTPGAAERLAKDLSHAQMQPLQGIPEEELGLFVEPVQLQIVCFRLWNAWQKDKPTATQIDESYVVQLASVDNALADYYTEKVQVIAQETKVPERAIRDWFERALITKHGFRGQVLEGAEESNELNKQALQSLVAAILVRTGQRHRTTWFELAHDRLIRPIQKSNAEWREKNFGMLADHYSEQVQIIAQDTNVSVQAIRDWLEHALITDQGTRGTALKGDQESEEPNEQALQRLIDVNLVRIVERNDATWFELADDRLIQPIVKNNADWRKKNLNLLQRRALIWTSAGEAPELLLRDEELRKEERWATNVKLTRIEDKFLKACIEARQNRQTRRNRNLAIILAVIVTIIAVIAGFLAYRQSQIALSRQLAAQSNIHLDDQYDLALLLSLDAIRVDNTIEARGSLLTALEHNPRLDTILRGHQERVKAVAFNRDGTILASGGEDATIRLWNANTAQPLQASSILTSNSKILSLAFSPDGKTLASGTDTGIITLWNIGTKHTRRDSFDTHGVQINQLAYSPDGKLLLSVGKKGLMLWDGTVVGRQVEWQLDSKSEVGSAAFSPDGRSIAIGFNNGQIQLWNITNRQITQTFATGFTGRVNSLSFSSDGIKLAIGGGKRVEEQKYEPFLMIWDISSQTSTPLVGHTEEVQSVVFNISGELLASASRDRTIILWDVATGKQIGSPLAGHSDWIFSLAFSPDKHYKDRLASAGADSNVIVWNALAPQRLGRSLIGHEDEVWSVAFSPDGRSLASGGKDGKAMVWDISTGKAVALDDGHTQEVRTVAFSPDGGMFATGSHDGTIILWKLETSRWVATVPSLKHGEQWVSSVAFSPDGRLLASGGFDGKVLLWDLAQQPPTSILLPGDFIKIWSVAFSPDGKTVAASADTSADNGVIVLWHIATRQVDQQFPVGHLVLSVAFSPDSKTLALASLDKTVVLWDVVKGHPVASLQRHTDAVQSVAFSPDGKTLASGSVDGSVILWDVAAQQMIGNALQGHNAPINSVAFSQDSKIVASAGDDSSIVLWNVDINSWVERACQFAGRNLTTQELQQYVDIELFQLRSEPCSAAENSQNDVFTLH
uniref:High-affnity carbon uptake protein Hat/HatR n=1 Tax=uncultured bacterium A1Q1_fos_1880 TaxID=1256556 RepID=L7VRB2_9BACT|nr:high-affnity carbon uptake protein Hat/HatR [uncultured bacterium A1Q1_fos_1880]